MSRADVVAIVLAGGASSRFGSDKMAARLDGRPLLHHALEAVAEVARRIIVVMAPGAAEPIVPSAVAGQVQIARDSVAHAGPLAGLAAGLAAVRDEPPRIVLVVGGDMPALVPGVLRLLLDSLTANSNLAAMTLAASPPPPLPMAARPTGISDAIAACLVGDRRSLRALLDAVPSAPVPEASWRALDPGARTLADVDRPDDLLPGDG